MKNELTPEQLAKIQADFEVATGLVERGALPAVVSFFQRVAGENFQTMAQAAVELGLATGKSIERAMADILLPEVVDAKGKVARTAAN